MKRGGGEGGEWAKKLRALLSFAHSPIRPVAHSGFYDAVVILLTFMDRREIFRDAVDL